MEEWAPPEVAWKGDNVGLQLGTEKQEVKRIFLCLELNQDSLSAALKQNADLIITHHPFIFNPIKKLNFTKDDKSKLLRELIKNDISLFSAHTNLDFTKDGVSFQLAKKLNLRNIGFLKNQDENQFKVVVFVPANFANQVSEAIFAAGAGVIGNYEKCSYRTSGKGTFIGNENTNPAIGSKGNFEEVDELRIEILTDQWKLNKVVNALIKAHPYEEPAYDIYPLKNKNQNYGYGAIGDLEKPLSPKEFLNHLVKNLKCKNLRYTEGKGKIMRVAVCGGSCADLLNDAIYAKADAFVTADLKYHDFEKARGKILFVDAGHYETEIHVLDVIKDRLEKFMRKENDYAEIIKFKGSTNPVRFYK